MTNNPNWGLGASFSSAFPFGTMSSWDARINIKVGKSEVTCNMKAGCLDKGFSNIPAECEHGISPNAGTHTSSVFERTKTCQEN